MAQQDSAETAAKKQRFVANLRKLMAGRGFSVSETAHQAGIDRKRFYRWATSGIARAARSHQADLDKLRWLFGLSSWHELWGDDVTVSVEDQLIAAASAKPDYGYAAKVLFLLRTLGKTASTELKGQIDKLFEDATRDGVPEQLMRVLSPKQVLDHVRTASPSAYTNIVAEGGGNVNEAVERELISTTPDRLIPLIVNLFGDSTPPASDPIQPPQPTSIGGASLPVPDDDESDDDEYGEDDDDDYEDDEDGDEDYDDDE